jgi:hypothetical protein
MSVPAALPVFLTIDVGPALATLGEHLRPDADWDATLRGIDLLREGLPALADRVDAALPATWFVRADDFVARQLGSPLAMVRRFRDATAGWDDGHELAWMPHLPDPSRAAIDLDALRRIHAAWSAELPAPECTRMGDLYHDNATMGVLDELGVRFDCTAAPGRTKFDPPWRVDWRGTPAHAYHPSCADYRVPGAPHRNLLEIPLTMLLMRTSYDPAPLARYVNPCFLPPLLWPALDDVLAATPWLTLLLHPDELVAGQSRAHPMLAYSTTTFADNLARVVARARSVGRQVTFHRLRDFAHATAAHG